MLEDTYLEEDNQAYESERKLKPVHSNLALQGNKASVSLMTVLES